MKQSTESKKMNLWINYIYVSLLLVMILGFNIFDYVYYFKVDIQVYKNPIERYIGSVYGILFFVVCLTILRSY